MNYNTNYNDKQFINYTTNTIERQLSEQVGTNPSSDKWTDSLNNVPDYSKTITIYPGLFSTV